MLPLCSLRYISIIPKMFRKKYLKKKKNPEFWRISAPQNVRSEPRFVEFRTIPNLRILKFFAYVLKDPMDA